MIILGNEYSEKETVLGQMILYKKYSEENLEMNVIALKKNAALFLCPPKVEKSIEIYRVLEGKILLPVSERVLSAHDTIILKPGDEHLSLEAIESTNLLVTSIGFNSFDYTITKMDKIASILQSIQDKDYYTNEHSKRVVEYCKRMARALKLSDKETLYLLTAARYHDLGKISISDQILNKPDKLERPEYETMKKHVMHTKELLLDQVRHEIIDIALEHHERLDGTGYPNGLIGNEISYLGQILAVVDTFDAMTTDRVYKKGKSKKEAFEELYGLSDKYNIAIVKTLESIL